MKFIMVLYSNKFQKCLVHYAVLFALAVFPAVSTGAPEEVDKSDKLKALKIELEEQKQLRDRVIAKRWKDKRAYNESREKFNNQYDDQKDKLEQKNSQLESIRESVEYLRKDTEELKSRLENEKIQFMGLSYIQKSAVDEIANQLGKHFPAEIIERQEKINQAAKSAETKKDSPSEILDEVLSLYLEEIKLTREIVVEKKGLMLSGHEPGFGTMVRVGTAASVYKDDKSSRTGILLRSSFSSGKMFEWREDIIPAAKESLNKNLDILESAAAGKTDTDVSVLPMDVLRTRFAGKGYTQGERQGLANAAAAYFNAGGVWMWPLLAIALSALLLLIERIIQWTLRNSGSDKLFEKVMAELKANKLPDAGKLCKSRKHSSVLKVMAAVLNQHDKSRAIAEKELEETMLREGPALEKRLTTISVLGAAAPLLGLLGTVAGMIELFESITLYGTSDPKLMASGISVALITTQAGLAISVPILILHNFMANRTDGLLNKMDSYSLRVLNLLWPNG